MYVCVYVCNDASFIVSRKHLLSKIDDKVLTNRNTEIILALI